MPADRRPDRCLTDLERAAYELGWAAQRLINDLTHHPDESTLVHMTDAETDRPVPCQCKPKCLDCRDGVHDGCMYGCR